MEKMPPALCQMHSAGGIPVSSDLIFPDEELFVGWHFPFCEAVKTRCIPWRSSQDSTHRTRFQ